MAEIVPEGDAEFGAGQQQAGEGVPALASLIGAGTAGDLALDYPSRGSMTRCRGRQRRSRRERPVGAGRVPSRWC